MTMSDAEKSWVFRFSLEAQDGSMVPYSQAEELIDMIIEWVEARSLQIGGGFRPPTQEELNPKSLPLRSEREI
jgi:hypothetical protein